MTLVNTKTPPPSPEPSRFAVSRGLLGVAGTGLAMWFYAALLGGYDRFYYGIGLNLSDLSLGFEEALVPLLRLAITFGFLVALVLACIWAGAVAVYSIFRKEHPLTTYTVLVVVIAVAFFDWPSSGGLAEVMITGHILGIFVAALAHLPAALRSLAPSNDSERHRPRRVELNMVFIGVFLALTLGLTGFFREPGPAAALIQALATVVAMLAGPRWLVHRGERSSVGNPADAASTLAQYVCSVTLGSRRRKFFTMMLALLAGLLVPIAAMAHWEQRMEDKGVEAARYGYVLPGDFENLNPEGLRPITMARSDLQDDPLGLCQERVYAASLVEPVTDRQWILLRPVDGGEDRLVRVTPLPDDAYTYQFASIPESNEDGSPAAWTTDACRDRGLPLEL
ncbi:hypothetical protein [Glycomyces buryatensis]|uniref:Uncharacterized protein n=1 Tax=Glycomyces buryatensis TaxID=2570927 RepID=A0A4S8QDJ7_9ACTN|nr:hypothetical protein [Glycomyces buryatensis]THV41162.1 hypothetical protein FAB82_13000 [Glycomyces buryatensis]